jgi:hypothetical protein
MSIIKTDSWGPIPSSLHSKQTLQSQALRKPRGVKVSFLNHTFDQEVISDPKTSSMVFQIPLSLFPFSAWN